MDDSLQVERAKRGDRDAFSAIYEEHAAGTWRLALAVRPQPDAAATAVAGAFGSVLSRRRTPDRQRPVRLQLLAAARDAAMTDDRRPGRGVELAASGSTVVELFPSGSAVLRDDAGVEAFERLPEHWRSVLWLTEVEGLDLEQTAAVIGLPIQTTTELAARAHAGLREQFALAQVGSVRSTDCQRAASLLGGYGSRSLSTRDTARVRQHLDDCGACRDRLDAIDDLPPRLRLAIPVVPVALFGLAEQAWATHIDRATGPLGLILPGGRPVPPWAERALAGATAAVVTLGITGAILAGGRGGTNRGPELAGAGTEQPISEGESALGAGVDDGRSTTRLPVDLGTSVTTGVGDLSRSTDDSTSTPTTVGALPRGGPESTPPTTVAPATPVAPVTPTTPVAPDEPAPAEPAPEPPSGSTPPVAAVRVDEDTAVSVGGECTGVELLGIVVGCEPGSDTTLPTGSSLLP